jgi:hypothetical protein
MEDTHHIVGIGIEETSEEQNPTHEYSSAGNYTVTLTVTDDNESVTIDTTWALIMEENNPPSAPTITGETNGKFGESYDYTFIYKLRSGLVPIFQDRKLLLVILGMIGALIPLEQKHETYLKKKAIGHILK